MEFNAPTLALATGGTHVQNGIYPEGRNKGKICTDTRNIQPGDWFLAIAGERFDGHNFVEKARALGAAGVIGQHVPKDWTHGFVQVDDSIIALQNAARYTRAHFKGKVVAITGSAGKTTTRALVASVLSQSMHTLETHGNFNNHLGLPLTILRSNLDEDVWILELGMNHLGEIDLLQEIAKPHIRVITNVGAAHLEGVGDLDGVAKAKGEIFAGAQPADLCLINADDARICALKLPEGVRVQSFGYASKYIRIKEAYINAQKLTTHVGISTPKGDIDLAIASPGLHLASNIAIAVAIGVELDCTLEQIHKGVGQYEPVGARLRVEPGPRNTLLLNDAYNANPLSTRASLKTLASLSSHVRIALLGDMLELGAQAQQAHDDILAFALSLDIDVVGVCGSHFVASAQKHTAASLIYASDAIELGKRLLPLLKGSEILLLKGSRGSKMETLLKPLGEQ